MRKLLYFSIYLAISWAFYVSFLEPKATFFRYTEGFDGRIVPFVLVIVWFIFTTRFEFRKPTDFVLAMFAFNTGIPIALFYLFSGSDSGILIVLVSLHLSILVFRTIPMPKVKLANMGPGSLALFLILPIALLFALTFSVLGTANLVSSFSDVYDQRAAVTEVLSESPLLIRYTTVWLASVLIPLLLLSLFEGRHYIWLGVFSFLPILAFMVTTHKAAAVESFFLLAILFLLHKRFSLRVVVLLYGGILAAGLIISYFGSDFFSMLFPRRLLYIPAFWSVSYVEFFADLPNVKYSHSVLSWLFQYPFDQPYPVLVGEEKTNVEGAWANTGVVGTSFMHFGFAGPVMFGAVLGLLFSLVDRSTLAKTKPVLASILAFMGFDVILTSSDLMTGLLSQGFFIIYAVLCINMLPKSETFETVSEDKNESSPVVSNSNGLPASAEPVVSSS